ncbi:hypothetical protein MRS44_013555 [Fusarium solani]|uniref:uncharacterized protein n=1 Tax=Fusarium solani TaxID=169388 RepID=UPI0032C3D95F|nr:hypothetical protein MRS44_017740 [Fusarium solani]KAJ3454955.1 hypothetical protein MRS44_013555 [Fusarium solani]
MTVQMGIALYRSRCRFHLADLSWSSKPIIQVLVRLQSRLKVEPGQYINLWIPSSLLSTLQIHPFTVASWSPDAAETLVVFAEIRKGFTSSLRNKVRFGDSQSFAMFTGPHGSRLPVDKYDHVLLIATDLGIVALLPYLQWLTHAHHAHQLEEGTNRFKSCRSIHLIWHLRDWEVFVAVSYFLNVALAEDELRASNACKICGTEHRSIIKLTVYGEKATIGQDEGHGAANARKLADSVRGDIHWEPIDLPSILDEELSSILDDETVTGVTRDVSRKPCAVAASVSRKFRDQLTDAARAKLPHIDLMFTEYQP